jgi:hypothetical protein
MPQRGRDPSQSLHSTMNKNPGKAFVACCRINAFRRS